MATGGIESVGYDFITNAIGQIIAMIAAIFAAAKWIDKRYQDKIEVTKKEILDSINTVQKNSEFVRAYIEKDISRLENSVENLRIGRDSMQGSRRYHNGNE